MLELGRDTTGTGINLIPSIGQRDCATTCLPFFERLYCLVIIFFFFFFFATVLFLVFQQHPSLYVGKRDT